MRRSGRRANTPLGISLFPFLAVLLCTMGSLIVLLICLVERAGIAAPVEETEVAAAEAGPSPEEIAKLVDAADDAAFVAEQLKKKKEEYSQTLKRMREEMSIAERLLREQQDEAKRMQAQLAAIRAGGGNEDALEVANERIEQVKAEIAKLESDLKRKQKELANKPKRMSIIPHKGRHGTTQRPIYVECRADKVVILPEGIEFQDSDFALAKSAGNPLDASLRAVKEYFAEKTKERGEEAPYPLFVVRPGGDVAFIKARSAIVSWEDEFGYELVDASVELEYPPADPALSQVVERAANDARRRQEALAKALPGRFRGGNSGGGGGENGGTQGGQGSRGRDGGIGSTGGTGTGPKSSGKRFNGNQGVAPTVADQEEGVGGPDSRYLDGVAPKDAGKLKYAGNPGTKDGSSKPGEAPYRHGATKEGDKDGVPGGEGGAAALEQVKRRAKNWANKGANSTSTPVTRKISVRCSASQISFLPPKGTPGKPITIDWAGNPVNVVDSIALQVNNRINSWGMAIGGGYWQPVLDVEVSPDGEGRYAELAEYFDQSGIEVRRKVR